MPRKYTIWSAEWRFTVTLAAYKYEAYLAGASIRPPYSTASFPIYLSIRLSRAIMYFTIFFALAASALVANAAAVVEKRGGGGRSPSTIP